MLPDLPSTPKLSPADRAQLREKALAIPTGDWDWPPSFDDLYPEEDEFIALASPHVVLGLLEELDRLKAFVRKVAHHPCDGVFRTQGCNCLSCQALRIEVKDPSR